MTFLLQRWATARPVGYVLAALFVLATFSGAAFAQTETGQITGKVSDPNGAVVSGANVLVKSVDTGREVTATSNEEGFYTVTNLQPGLYEITVNSTGFAPNVQRAQITVGARLSLDNQLSVTAIGGDVVNVIAGEGGVEINTTDQQLSDVINNTQIRELPTLTRNPYALVGVAGNVTPDASGRGTGFAINGQRSASTGILLDGVENVDTFRASVGQEVPLDSVQEFRVVTGNFSAEIGRASGGVVNVATISGTNDFNGTAYAFNRISKLASNGFDNNARGIPRQVFTRNQFGYSVGGPVVKDKLFFFNSTEWIRVRSGGARVAFVPTSQFLAASSAATRAFFAPYQINGEAGPVRTASQVLADFGGASQFAPTPNAATNAFLTFAQANPNTPVFQQVTYSTPADVGGGIPQNQYQTVVRMDYNLTDKTQLYGRYALQDQVFAEGTNAFSPYQGFSTASTNFNQNILLNLTHSFSSNLVSQTKLAYNRLNGGSPLGEQPLVPTLYMNQARTVNIQGVSIALPGYLPFSPGNAIPFAGAQNVYQLNQDINLTAGKHNWRFGGQFVQIRDNKTFGAYSYAVEVLGNNNPESLSNFLTGNLVSFSVAIDPGNRYPGASIPLPVGPPSFSRSNRYNEWAAYVNDSVRVNERVTVNLGLRYEFYGVQKNAQDPRLDANFYYGPGNNFPEQIASGRYFTVPESGVGGLWTKDWNNFAPRLGFAWDVTGDGRTSIRGGYGIAYERNFGNVTFNVLFNPPNYGVVALAADSINSAGVRSAGDVPTLPVSIANYGPFSGTGPARTFTPVSARHVDQNIRNAYSHFWSASFERQLTSSTVFSLDYSGSAGAQLYSISDINRTGVRPAFGLPNIPNVVGQTITRLNPTSTSINSRGNLGRSNYSGLTASLESNNFRDYGLAFSARYTYSRARDNLSSTFAETGQVFFLGFTDTFNPELDYGYADFDVRHRFSGSFNYEVPFRGDSALTRNLLGGWSLNGLVSIRSGFPFPIFDCTFANATCGRLVTSDSLDINNDPSDTGDPNSFTLINLSGFRNAQGRVINPALGNAITGNYNVGPFPNASAWSPRNAFRGPGFWDITTGLYKRFRFTENLSLQLRAEVFNLFNHANLNTNYDSTDVSAGNVLGFRDGRRNVQLAAKFIF